MNKTLITSKSIKAAYKSGNELHDSFAKFVKQRSQGQEADLNTLVDLVKEIEADKIDLQNADPKWRIETAVVELCTHYIAAYVSSSYLLIPEEIFGLTRWLQLDVADPRNIKVIQDDLDTPLTTSAVIPKGRRGRPDSIWVQIPLVITRSLGSLDYDRIDRVNYSNSLNFSISAAFPSSLSRATIEKRFSAAAVLHRGIANLLECPTLAPYLFRENDWSRIALDTAVGWVPRVQDIYFTQAPALVPGDPILFLAFRGKKFLIDSWEVAEEHPVAQKMQQFLKG